MIGPGPSHAVFPDGDAPTPVDITTHSRDMSVEGYEFIPDPGADGMRTKKQERAQREHEEINRAARELARAAPPLSPESIERLRAILSRRTPPEDLMLWRLRLFCGHVVERHAHYTHTTVHAAFMGAVACPECGLDPATIVAAEVLGRLGEPHASA